MDDLIRRSDVIGLLEDMLLFGEYDIIASSFSKADEEKAYRAINDIPAANRWISVEDELPEIRTPVMIKCKCRYPQFGEDIGSVRISMGMWRERLTEGKIEWLFYGNMFYKDGIGARVHLSGWDVIAWMPMPDAYDPPEKE